MFKNLTSRTRKCALIFDDTFFDRMRSKKVELLSWTFDHVEWDIEVFFKMCKSYLKFAKEFQGRSYDMLVAHKTIVYIRYIMFAFSSRLANDDRSFGDFFYKCCDDVKAISFWDAFQLILKLLKQLLKKKFLLTEQDVNQILDEFITSLPSFLFQNLMKKKCES